MQTVLLRLVLVLLLLVVLLVLVGLGVRYTVVFVCNPYYLHTCENCGEFMGYGRRREDVFVDND